MFELTIITNFEAAHRMPDYPGKCQRLHGHNWKVEVTVQGSNLDKLGMLIDFCDLKNEVNKVVDTLDHFYLNEIETFKTINPTAENIAKYIYEELAVSPVLVEKVRVVNVKVWESPHSAAVYYREVNG